LAVFGVEWSASPPGKEPTVPTGSCLFFPYKIINSKIEKESAF
jgi:hypothetical protein